eukprot:337184_1
MSSSSLTIESKNMNKTLNIIHFNDVYNITEDTSNNICGGAARFGTVMNKLKSLSPPPLIFFSGDFLSPSNISTITKGEHMIEIMNNFGITCGMIGNHDLDFGNEHCIKCLSKLNYPTLNSNIFTPIDDSKDETKAELDGNSDERNLEPLGKCKTQLIINNYYGFNIGIIGVSEDWCNTVPTAPKNGFVYKNFIKQCEIYVKKIKQENDLNVIIVLTHSRKQNDILLGNNVSGIDLILGGHDHMYHVEMNKINKSLLVKSGCDFKDLTYVKLQQKNNEQYTNQNNELIISELNDICLSECKNNLIGLNYNYTAYHYSINKQLIPDIKLKAIIAKLHDKFLSEMNKPVGYINCNLDTRFKMIRKYESSACNLICDIVRNAYKCDIVLLCGGGIRSDKIHQKGVITFKDILDLVPFQDPIIVKKIIGKDIINSIQHSIANLPKLDGRFAHVSGLKYCYDSSKQTGKRLINVQFSKDNKRFVDIEMDKYYTFGSREYTMNGGDGFEYLKNNEIIIGKDKGLPLSELLKRFFWAISTVNDGIKLINDNKNGTNDTNGNGIIHEFESFVKIEPMIEGRIVDIAEKINNCSIINVENKNGVSYASWEIYNKLPSFVDMKNKLQETKSIIQFAANFAH